MDTPTPLVIADFTLGQRAEYSRTVSAADIQAFAEVTGDHNPVHLNEAYAANTQFGQRIAHGILSVGFFSTVLGTQLPGPGCIYLSQTAKFKAPVFIGDTVTVVVEITDIDAHRKRISLSTNAYVDTKLVTTGEALMYIP